MNGEWISVSEGLPDEYETVLVATDGRVSAGELRLPDSECGMDEPWWMVFKDKRDGSVAWAGLVSLNDVTHWTPLPKPPQSTDTKNATVAPLAEDHFFDCHDAANEIERLRKSNG
jgi:hypothetical protein